MDPALADRLAKALRAADPDRYFASLFVPAAVRPFLVALYAFNAEVARVAENVREPMLGAIRLEWWRETAQSAAEGKPRNHDVARGLAALFDAYPVKRAALEAIIAARAFDSAPDLFADFAALESYLDATSGALMRIAAKILGGDPGRVGEAGLAYGLTGILRSLAFHSRRHKLYLPRDILAAADLAPEDFFHLEHGDGRRAGIVNQAALRARTHFLAARRAPRPGAAMAAVLPAALVPVYLRNLESRRDVPIHRRQLALLGAAMKGRL
jgi:phytoene synthase